jgi:hypothetical protein
MSKLQETPSALKREHPALQLFVSRFFPPGSVYGSRDPIESGSTALLKCKLLDKFSLDKLLYYKEKKRKINKYFKLLRILDNYCSFRTNIIH